MTINGYLINQTWFFENEITQHRLTRGASSITGAQTMQTSSGCITPGVLGEKIFKIELMIKPAQVLSITEARKSICRTIDKIISICEGTVTIEPDNIDRSSPESKKYEEKSKEKSSVYEKYLTSDSPYVSVPYSAKLTNIRAEKNRYVVDSNTKIYGTLKSYNHKELLQGRLHKLTLEIEGFEVRELMSKLVIEGNGTGICLFNLGQYLKHGVMYPININAEISNISDDSYLRIGGINKDLYPVNNDLHFMCKPSGGKHGRLDRFLLDYIGQVSLAGKIGGTSYTDNSILKYLSFKGFPYLRFGSDDRMFVNINVPGNEHVKITVTIYEVII